MTLFIKYKTKFSVIGISRSSLRTGACRRGFSTYIVPHTNVRFFRRLQLSVNCQLVGGRCDGTRVSLKVIFKNNQEWFC